MFNIVLYEPEIPPNTGNIIRLCANTGCALHLIEPLGFEMNDKLLRRAGLDYREFTDVQVQKSLDDYLDGRPASQVYAISTRGNLNYDQIEYQPGDSLLFGPETRGLPDEVRNGFKTIRIPMLENSRSLNLSNSVAVIVYEALRQRGFENLI